MWDALGYLGACMLFIVVVILPLVGVIKLIGWYMEWVERHGIQIGDDDDDDASFDSWWQFPPGKYP